MNAKLWRLGLAAALALVFPSCFSYHVDFQKAVKAADGKFDDPTGPWVGDWKSNHNGHHGPLWCIISETPDKPGFYDFRYRAGWGILKFGDYTHTVQAEKTPEGNLKVTGQMELPKFVGNYSLDGTVTKTEFDAKYKSNVGDHGIMTLRRPKVGAKENDAPAEDEAATPEAKPE